MANFNAGKDAEDPSTTSFAWDVMISKWEMIDTLLRGTEAMRDAGQRFLPIHEVESRGNYMERLTKCTLLNMLEITLDALVGRPFSDPIVINSDMPASIEALMEDVDLRGNDLTVFAREWFRQGLAKGFCHVLIDFPRIPEEDFGTRTLEDDAIEGRRPYWVLIKPENVIFATSEFLVGEDGVLRETLTHVRISELDVERVGFAEVVKERIRVLEPGRFAVFEKEEKRRKNQKDKWKLIDAGETGLSIIPLVTFYSDRDGLMMAKPPLEDLGHLNVRHWQSTSDQISVLTVARFPMLAVAGAVEQPGSEMAIGPKQLLGTKDPNGKFYYVEHTGESIDAGRQDLMDLEDQMVHYGAQFLKKETGNETATARALDSAEATSALQDYTVRFMDSIANALDVMAMWMGEKDGGTVTIATDFGPETPDSVDMEALTDGRKRRDLSREAWIEEMMRRGALKDDFDAEADFKKVMQEKVRLTAGSVIMDSDEINDEEVNLSNRNMKLEQSNTDPKGGSSNG